MNGAEALVRTLLVNGVDTCFANPGTSEIHIVAALDRVPSLRCMLGLFEGVVTGAADGYARMAERPACTVLHLGPGLANGLANLHNAKRAQVPIVNIVGQHASHHLKHDTPLSSDIEGIARPFSGWVRTSRALSDVGCDAADAVVAARTAPGQIATLIVPADAAWNDDATIGPTARVPNPPLPSQAAIQRACTMLRSRSRNGILLWGKALYGKGLRIAGRIAHATGATLLCPYPLTRIERGAGLPPVERVHYLLEQAVEQLKDYRQLILVGAQPPVAYFAYPGKSSVMTSPECEIFELASADQDCVGALEAIAEDFSAHQDSVVEVERPPVPSGEITLRGLTAAVGALLPEDCIVIDESVTSGRGLMGATKGCPRHDWLGNPGGSIGIALPLAIGAAVACPDRKVLCLTADGSAMYTVQGLWTMARESLKVTVVVFANCSYEILKREFLNLGLGDPGPRSSALFDIGQPDLDWVQLSRGMGVPAQRVNSLDSFGKALRAGFASDGPSLIEVPL
jgi:acetolactate synthase-1/2/3 large subunit